MIHATLDEPFFTACCGVRIVGDITPGETLCPYCEREIPRVCGLCGVSEDEDEMIVVDDDGSCICYDCGGVLDDVIDEMG